MADFILDFKYQDLIPPHQRIVIVGEASHGIRPYTRELARALKALKAVGFSHFGLEMLPSAYNKDIKRYSASGQMSESLTQYLSQWTHRDAYQTPLNYRELIDDARSAGMQIVGLDIHIDDWFDMEQRASHLKRNHHMADEIARIARRGHRIVAFMHHRHAETTDVFGSGVKRTLKELHQLDATFIKLVGGTSCVLPDDCRRPGRLPLEVRAITAGMATERFYIEGKGGLDKADYLLHLPQIVVAQESALP